MNFFQTKFKFMDISNKVLDPFVSFISSKIFSRERSLVILRLVTIFTMAASSMQAQCYRDIELIQCGQFTTDVWEGTLLGASDEISSYQGSGQDFNASGVERKYLVNGFGKIEVPFSELTVTLRNVPPGANYALIVGNNPDCDGNARYKAIASSAAQTTKTLTVEITRIEDNVLIAVEHLSGPLGSFDLEVSYSEGSGIFCSTNIAGGIPLSNNQIVTGQTTPFNCLFENPPICIPQSAYYSTDQGTLCGYGAQERVFTYEPISSESELSVIFEGDSNQRIFLYVEIDAQDAVPLLYGILSPTSLAQTIQWPNANAYHFVIDGTTAGNFSLNVFENNCDFQKISCGDYRTGPWVGSSVYSNYECDNNFYNGPEKIFTFVPPVSGEYVISTSFANLNTQPPPKTFIQDCCPIEPWVGRMDTVGQHNFSQNNCVCFDSSPVAGRSVVTAMLEAGKTYYIIIENTNTQIPDNSQGWTIQIDCPILCSTADRIECAERRNNLNNQSGTNLLNAHPGYRNATDGCKVNTGNPSGVDSSFPERERVFQFVSPRRNTPQRKEFVFFDLFPSGMRLNAQFGNVDYDLFVYDGCDESSQMPTNLLAASTLEPGKNDGVYLRIDSTLFEADFYPIVDAQFPQSENYDFVVTCGDNDDLRAKVKPINCGDTVSGDTRPANGGTNFISHYCGCTEVANPTTSGISGGGNTGNEDVYSFQLSTASEVEIRLFDFADLADLELFLLDTLDFRRCRFSSRGDNISPTGPNDEVIRRQLPAGTYYIVVEGFNVSNSAYKLSLSGCDECDLVTPVPSMKDSNFVRFIKPINIQIEYFVVSGPCDSLASGNFTFRDTVEVIDQRFVEYYFDRAGCYQLCFYYRDATGQIQECCFKYCHTGKYFDDCMKPFISAYEDLPGDICEFNLFCTELPTRGSAMEDSCKIKIVRLDIPQDLGFFENGERVTLPYGEYEICCWKYDPVCKGWNQCCEIFCFPYVRPDENNDGNLITYEKDPINYNQYTFRFDGEGFTNWEVTPDAGAIIFNPDNEVTRITFPASSSRRIFKVCAYGERRIPGGVIINRSYCVNVCVDPMPMHDCESSISIAPLPDNHVRLSCNLGKRVIRWEVLNITNLSVPVIYYGPNPIVRLFPGISYDITKVFEGCCGSEETCKTRLCYDDPFDCQLIMPKYLGTAQNPELRYEFSVPEGFVVKEWKIDELDLVIGTNTNLVSHLFPSPGCFTVSALVYDPISECYIICCKRICVDNPFNCGLLKHWFTGDESNPYQYTIRFQDDCQTPMLQQQGDVNKWTINGIYRPEFDGLASLDNIDLSSYGPIGSDVVICLMYYDPCSRACRWCCFKIRLEPPFNCDVFTEVFIAENDYSFSASGNFEASYWSIGGLEGIVFSENVTTFNLSNPMIQNFIADTQPDYMYVYFYYRVNNCWKVCCKRICLKGPDGCEKFGEECDYFTPLYNEDFENGPPQGFGYMEGDSININQDWWKGSGIVATGLGKIVNNEILCLRVGPEETQNAQVFKVTFDFSAEWTRNIGNGAYTYELAGLFALCVDSAICYSPTLLEILENNPGLLKPCDIGDLGTCFHKAEILIDRSGHIEIFIDGRKVDFPDNAWSDQGALVDKINFANIDPLTDFYIDSICVAECKKCIPPTVNPGGFEPCTFVALKGFQTTSDSEIGATFEFTGSETNAGWVINEMQGTDLVTILENDVESTEFFFPGFRPGRTYVVCSKYVDENGCIQYCCYKVTIPSNCGYFTPYFRGDETSLNFEFVLEEQNPDGLELVGWYVGNQSISGTGNSFSYVFPTPGVYYVYCKFWDPINKCYVWCCRKICVDFPLNCDRIKVDYDGSNESYILRAEGVQQVISWNIDIPLGIPNNGFIGSGNPQVFKPSDFGIMPGQEIIISVRYIDADGCIKICCRRICIPVQNPIEECSNIFPVFTGEGLSYRFELDPADGFENVTWSIHIPGTTQTVEIGSGPTSDVVDFEALMQQYPSLGLDKVCVSIFYLDAATGCWRVCCKCFCLQDSPFDCGNIDYFYSGTPINKMVYTFDLQVENPTLIKWTFDEANVVLSTEKTFVVDFSTYNAQIGEEITVSVRYFDPVTRCFRVCCKRICLVDPYLPCNKITAGPVENNAVSLSTSVTNPVWTIEGLPGVFSRSNTPVINLTDPNIIPLLQGASTINVCVVYMENGCCRVCCQPICVIPANIECDNFSVNSEIQGNQIVFDLSDSNVGGIETTITIPNGNVVTLAGDITSYSNTLEGSYTICRSYLDGCNDTINCCNTICISNELLCEPFTVAISDTNELLFSFTHNVIGGLTYMWDFGDGTTSNSSLTTVSHEYPEGNQIYTVCLTVVDECGNECVQCREIEVGAINFSPMTENPTCKNVNDGSINLNIAGGIPPIRIEWSTGATEPALTGLGAGSYSVTITEGQGEDTTFTFVLTAPDLPELETNVVHTSCGETNGQVEITLLNGIEIETYMWSDSTIGSSALASGLKAGTYEVTLTDANGCISIITGLVVNPSEAILPFNFGPDIDLCPADSVTLDLGVLNAASINIAWYKDDIQLAANTRTLKVAESGTYIASVSSNQNCERRDTINVNVFDDNIVFPEDIQDAVVGDDIRLEVTGAASAQWSSQEAILTCTECLATSFIFEISSQIYVLAKDENGCEKSDTIKVIFDTSPIDGPNFITPNGDGKNDFLEFKGLEKFEFTRLTVINRWGKVLLDQEGYNNDWGGLISESELPDGVYFYVLRYGMKTPEEFELKKDLTILRKQ